VLLLSIVVGAGGGKTFGGVSGQSDAVALRPGILIGLLLKSPPLCTVGSGSAGVGSRFAGAADFGSSGMP
jgi:hypothetical protein